MEYQHLNVKNYRKDPISPILLTQFLFLEFINIKVGIKVFLIFIPIEWFKNYNYNINL